jgi:Outer membrane protein beta-barrel domain
MKEKSIAFLLSVFLVSTIPAQNLFVGVKAGLSIPNLTAGGSNSNPLNTGYSSRLGPDAGIFAEDRFSDLFSLQIGLEYSSQGGKKDGLQAFTTPPQFAQMFPAGEAPPYLYANFKSIAKINYLMLPVLAKFGWNFGKQSAFRFYVDAGPFAALLLSAKQVTSDSSIVYSDPQGDQPITPGKESFYNTQDIKSDLHDLNAGIEGNIGIAYRCRKNYFFIEGGGNYGFINIQKGTANGKNNAGAATVVLGYAYALGK